MAITITGTARTNTAENGDITVVRDQSIATTPGVVLAVPAEPAATPASLLGTNTAPFNLTGTFLEIPFQGTSLIVEFLAENFANIAAATIEETVSFLRTTLDKKASVAGMRPFLHIQGVGGAVSMTTRKSGLHASIGTPAGTAAPVLGFAAAAAGTGLPTQLNFDIDQSSPANGVADVTGRFYTKLQAPLQGEVFVDLQDNPLSYTLDV